MTATKIRPRDRDAVLQSLRAGVVPRRGQHLVQVGRAGEIRAMTADIERIADGGSTIRFVIGAYGSGKTFFLQLVRSMAMKRKLVTAHADLNPNRRLHGSAGQARALYTELMRNLSTRAQPNGGAVDSVVERFVSTALTAARDRDVAPAVVLQERLHDLSTLVGGYDFAAVIEAYWRGHDQADDALKAASVRWLRGEFATKTDARRALGVRGIIDDANIWDHLKLMARFVRLAGYDGLMICMDEMVNLYKIHNTVSRTSNYEQILRIFNDSLQGTAMGLGVLLGGTPEFLTDSRRGLYSYEALQTRLAQNAFQRDGLVDFLGPVLRLASLTPEELYVLLTNIRRVFASGDPSKHLVPDDALHAYMHHCQQRIGEAYFRTPRNTITQFVFLLSTLEQNPTAQWQDLVGEVHIEVEPSAQLKAAAGNDDEEPGDDNLTSFRL
jgi:hypothetical protein